MSHSPNDKQIQNAYALAQERYAQLGVDTGKALGALPQIPLSLHCWQGDDVGGFENMGNELNGGIAATGDYPGKARNADELRRDLDQAYRLIPGNHRLNLHALYAETGGKRVERNELRPEHFAAWMDWAKATSHAIDFNPTLFSHPKAASGFTLASYDKGTRNFWIEHCIACRKISKTFGRELDSPCITNIWIPDGLKDTPANRRTPRELLRRSLDTIFAEKIDRQYNLDSVEGKLFGLGSESYVVGSHEFYLGYAITRGVLLCLDTGHFHPTETMQDAQETVNFIYAHQDSIHSASPGEFVLECYSPVQLNPATFGVKRISAKPEEDLAIYFDYELKSGLDANMAHTLVERLLDVLPGKRFGQYYVHDVNRFLYASHLRAQGKPFPAWLVNEEV